MTHLARRSGSSGRVRTLVGSFSIGEEEGWSAWEDWAEVRRLHRVEGDSIRGISRRTGLHRKTIRKALAAVEPPKYSWSTSGSKLDPFEDWIYEQLAAEPRIRSQRLREMASELGYAAGRSIFDDFVRDVRPRFSAPRTFQRTIY